jgi:hypothetical protein
MRSCLIAVAALVGACGPVLAAGEDLLSMADQVPALPAGVAAARAATQVRSPGGDAKLVAPAFEAHRRQVMTRIQGAATANTGGAIDVARMQSDPAYAQQMQAKIAAMSPTEKMAMAHTLQGGMGDPRVAGRVTAFLGQQRAADLAAQAKMRDTLEAAMKTAGRQHVETDRRLDQEAKACPQDKTGWPLDACTGPLGDRAIAEHRRIEDAALPLEAKALAEARAIADAELAKGRAVVAATPADAQASLAAWAGGYATLLGDYAEAMTLRAGFWGQANGRHYVGHVQAYIGAGGDAKITWPLAQPTQARIGL